MKNTAKRTKSTIDLVKFNSMAFTLVLLIASAARQYEYSTVLRMRCFVRKNQQIFCKTKLRAQQNQRKSRRRRKNIQDR